LLQYTCKLVIETEEPTPVLLDPGTCRIWAKLQDVCAALAEAQCRGMANLLKSAAAFKEKAADCGLLEGQLSVLAGKGIDTLATLAYVLTTPGVTPSEQALRELLDSTSPESVSLQALASIRRLTFEAQTLCIAQIKASIDTEGETKVELAPAERSQRISAQRKRLAGFDLTGPLENAYANYVYVSSMVEHDHPQWLELHRFIPRSQEISREKPGKEVVLDESAKLSIRDRRTKDRCQIQNELQLAEAMTRRALACDLLQVCTFAVMEKWHRFLLNKLSTPPPPNYRPTSMEQVLRADRQAWIRLAEEVPSLKRDASGELPLDVAFPKLQMDPHVTYFLQPSQGKSLLRVQAAEDEAPSSWRGRGRGFSRGKGGGRKRVADGNLKNEGASKGGGKAPAELQDNKLKHNTAEGLRICWNWNLAKSCSFAKAGQACKRGAHVCMFCLGPHSLLQCKTYKRDE